MTTTQTDDIEKLNRFTTLPFLFDMLFRKQLTLLNPDSWEDYNDRITVKAYKNKVNANSIYALCLTYKSETVHHWNAFANGPSGCCIEFDYQKLKALLDKKPNVRHSKSEYIKVSSISKYSTANYKDLPFIKRLPFKPENEYRIIATAENTQNPCFDIPINLNIITKITLSNKLPEISFNSVRSALGKLQPAVLSKIRRSTLYDNSTWVNYFTKLSQKNSS